MEAAGLTAAAARELAEAYREIANDNPGNPSAEGRAELMEHIAELLEAYEAEPPPEVAEPPPEVEEPPPDAEPPP